MHFETTPLYHSSPSFKVSTGIKKMIQDMSRISYLTKFEFYKACYGNDGSLYNRFITSISQSIIDAKNEVINVLTLKELFTEQKFLQSSY